MDKLFNIDYNNDLRKHISRSDFKKLKILCIFGYPLKSYIYVTHEDNVFAFGSNRFGCLGLGVTADDHIQQPTQNTTLSGKQLADICFGFGYCLGLTRSGQCYVWGNNDFGQLGDGTTDPSPEPKLIVELADKTVVQVCCGNSHNLLVTERGEVYGWGRNVFGQVGDRSFNITLLPTLLGFDERIASVSCGKCHSIALTVNGLVYVWGCNSNGQSGRALEAYNGDKYRAYCRPVLMTSMTDFVVTKVIAGADHSVLLTSEGFVYSFGKNSDGQLGNGKKENQWSPTRVGMNIKFKDVMTSYNFNMNVGLTVEGKYYIWGFTKDRKILEPREVSPHYYRSVHDLIVLNSKRRHPFKTIVNMSEDNEKGLKSLSDKKRIEELVVGIDFVSNEREVSNKLPLISSAIQLSSNSLNQTLISDSSVWLNCLSECFNNPSNYDIVFRFKDQLIYCHKTVLQIRNQRFWEKCSKRLNEEKTEIRVKRYSYKSFLALIQYFYTNCVDIDNQSVDQLLTLANIYGEEELKEMCIQLMISNVEINVTNVCQLYKESVEQEFNELANSCLSFVSKHFKQICLTQEFQRMDESIARKMISQSMKE